MCRRQFGCFASADDGDAAPGSPLMMAWNIDLKPGMSPVSRLLFSCAVAGMFAAERVKRALVRASSFKAWRCEFLGDAGR